METQEFERFEFKYCIPDAQSEEIRRFLAPFLVRDSFSNQGGSYQTTNLYFDSPRMDFYWAHVRSEINRFKLRVRYYADGPTCFFEIKRKVRDVIVKHRASLPRGKWEAVWAGDRDAIESSSNPQHLDEFLGLALLYRAEPRFLIRYEREAYENVFDEDARVTFDRRLCYQRVDDYNLAGEDSAWTFMDGSNTYRGLRAGTLLELKFDRHYPGWLREFVRKFNLVRTQFSKYLTTVETDAYIRNSDLEALPRSRIAGSPWRALLSGGIARDHRIPGSLAPVQKTPSED